MLCNTLNMPQLRQHQTIVWQHLTCPLPPTDTTTAAGRIKWFLTPGVATPQNILLFQINFRFSSVKVCWVNRMGFIHPPSQNWHSESATSPELFSYHLSFVKSYVMCNVVTAIRMDAAVSVLVLPSCGHCTGFSNETNTLHNSMKGSKKFHVKTELFIFRKILVNFYL